MNKNSKNYPFYAHVESYIQTTNSRLTSVGDLQWNLRKDLAHVRGKDSNMNFMEDEWND